MSETKQNTQDSKNRRQARAIQERQAKKKLRITTVIVVAVLVILVAGALLLNSNFLRRSVSVIKVGGRGFSATEYDFFFNSSYQEFRQMVESQGYTAYIPLPDANRPLASQIYDTETGETWSEYIGELTFNRLTEFVQYSDAAAQAGYVLSEEDRSTMRTEIEYMKSIAASSEGITSFDQFLQNVYGKSINEEIYTEICEFVYTVSSYCRDYRDALVYTDEQKKDYYSSTSDMLDVFSFRYITVSMESVSSSDYETDEEYQAARSESIAAALAAADEMAAGINSEDDFITAARTYNESTYGDDSSTRREYMGEMLGDIYGPWLRESERSYNDVTSVEMSNGAYVVYFIGRENNDYEMLSMRQLLLMRQEINTDDFELGADDPAYEEAFDLVDRMARERGVAALSLFEDGGATEELLIELMAEHSDDTTDGAFYENISKYYYSSDSTQSLKLVPEIEEWLFEEGRQVGDYELIRSEAYGYHLVYFTGESGKFCDFIADDRMRTDDYTGWVESLPKHDASKTWAFILTQR